MLLTELFMYCMYLGVSWSGSPCFLQQNFLWVSNCTGHYAPSIIYDLIITVVIQVLPCPIQAFHLVRLTNQLTIRPAISYLEQTENIMKLEIKHSLKNFCDVVHVIVKMRLSNWPNHLCKSWPKNFFRQARVVELLFLNFAIFFMLVLQALLWNMLQWKPSWLCQFYFCRDHITDLK